MAHYSNLFNKHQTYYIKCRFGGREAHRHFSKTQLKQEQVCVSRYKDDIFLKKSFFGLENGKVTFDLIFYMFYDFEISFFFVLNICKNRFSLIQSVVGSFARLL